MQIWSGNIISLPNGYSWDNTFIISFNPLAGFWRETASYQVRYGYNYDGNATNIYNSSGNYPWKERNISRAYIYLGKVPVLMSGNNWIYGIGYVDLDKYFVYQKQDKYMAGGCLAEIRFATVIN